MLLAILYVIAALVSAGAVWAWVMRSRLGWEIPTYLTGLGVLLVAGAILLGRPFDSYGYQTGLFLLGLAGAVGLFGLIEFGVLRLIGMFRLGAITRVTYYEALLQPFTLILIATGITAIVLAAFMPYFTINEDHKMFRDVAISLAFLFTLPIMIFSSTKVIDEEIENRTMLTLMSKPIARWQVVLGKYFGVLLLCLGVIMALGIAVAVCSYLRYFDDHRIDYMLAPPGSPDRATLDFANIHALRALGPAILLQFLQIATLAAVSVAVSTRFGLALNITVVVILYVVANLARYATAAELPAPMHALVSVVAGILPGLSFLDLNQRLVFGDYNYGTERVIPGLPSYSEIWAYVAFAAGYSVLYISAARSFGVALFRTRELT
jgi:ABC-type transport system involved in multi-copper enzyme maturation permease subunit